MYAMLEKNQAAARHRPIAHGRSATDGKADSGRDGHAETRRHSETRLQATVVADRTRHADDEYADVPCTD